MLEKIIKAILEFYSAVLPEASWEKVQKVCQRSAIVNKKKVPNL